ncbi:MULTISPECIES: FecCD family ABC transporter permease [Actinomyces]|uniref:Iron ABC transporter permease n=1 Tax=Actinomyces marmotae TaxID=2737173 RepID=A0A6M8B274_9ACTO|nr:MULTISPECIES: iron ABC transporter permease [Actinomyces]QKD80458.1 iron ABC transporter permease [Actinomyces marmotae]
MSAPALGFTDRGRRSRAARYWGVSAALLIGVVALWWASVLIGRTWYSPEEVIRVMMGERVPGASFSVGRLRLPRAMVGLLAGLAFGMAGTTSQTMLRNQLASPDIIGITSGASTAAVFSILVLGWSGPAVSILSIVAGLATAAAIYALSGSGRTQGARLILIGIGVSSMLSSLIAYLQLRAAIYDVPKAMRWLSGSLNDAAWEQVGILAIAVGVCALIMGVISRDLPLLALGEETAVGLGVATGRARLALVLTMVALASFATAATGPIAFVSFLAGPLAAGLVGRTHRTLLLPAALMGAIIVLSGDLLGQHAFPTTLPVGVVTGVVGAPYLILQLLRLNRQGASA